MRQRLAPRDPLLVRDASLHGGGRCKPDMAELQLEIMQPNSRLRNGLGGIIRVPNTQPDGRPRHDLRDAARSFGADRERVEATLLPNEPAQKTERKERRVSRRKNLVAKDALDSGRRRGGGEGLILRQRACRRAGAAKACARDRQPGEQAVHPQRFNRVPMRPDHRDGPPDPCTSEPRARSGIEEGMLCVDVSGWTEGAPAAHGMLSRVTQIAQTFKDLLSIEGRRLRSCGVSPGRENRPFGRNIQYLGSAGRQVQRQPQDCPFSRSSGRHGNAP